VEIKKGIAVSQGIAIGEAMVLDSEEFRIPQRTMQEHEIPEEIRRFESAVAAGVEELRIVVKRISKDFEDSSSISLIVEAQIRMLLDAQLRAKVRESITQNKFSAEHAVTKVVRTYAKFLTATGDEYFINRVQDFLDVERRLVKNLLGEKRENLANLTKPVVVIARDLSPSQTISLDKRMVLGFATDAGGATSHTAIIAKAMNIPAVVGLEDVTNEVAGGDTVVVDGNAGRLIVNPDDETLKKYRAMEKNFSYFGRKLFEELYDQPAVTKDGQHIELLANIEFLEEIQGALRYGAAGIGLFRTEFLFLDAKNPPVEKNHYDTYRKAVEHLEGRELTIRTLDLGADKFAFGSGPSKEKNPFLGCRAIRLCFENLPLFKAQLRAIFRIADVAKAGSVKLMIPMISGLEELVRVKDLMAVVKKELQEEGMSFKCPPLGIMIEVPSAAITADLLAKEVEFFSIGTNDLIQYTIAVDRVNERIASLYQPAHPAVIRLVRNTIEKGGEAGKDVSMCGEMSGDPRYTLLLLGLGLKRFSSAPAAIPQLKKVIRSVSMDQARDAAQNAMKLESSSRVLAFLADTTRRLVPDIVF
jgi:phosphotransferase system enzyme I (PtsI)